MAKNNNKNNWHSHVLGGSTPPQQSNEFARLYNHYKNLALNVYQWEGLPIGIESRHLERFLFEQGQCFFYDDKELGLMCLPSANSGHVNVYNDPTSVIVTGVGYSKQLKMSDGVRILNNDSLLPTHHHIHHYATCLSQLDDLCTMNMSQQKVPYIFATSKNSEFSVKTLFKKIFHSSSNEPAVFVDKDMLGGDVSNLQTLSTQAPYLLDKLVQYRQHLESELLTLLGINNLGVNEKKERLITAEADVNDVLINLNVELGLKQRQLACQKINEMFGLNVSVVVTCQKKSEEVEVELDGDV